MKPLSSNSRKVRVKVPPEGKPDDCMISFRVNPLSFFDNDSTSIMSYKASRPSRTNAENEVMIFLGKDEGGSGGNTVRFRGRTSGDRAGFTGSPRRGPACLPLRDLW